MKILFINYTYPLAINGGTERAISRLANYFKAQHQIYLIFFEKRAYSEDFIHAYLDLSKKENAGLRLSKFVEENKIEVIVNFCTILNKEVLKAIKNSKCRFISTLRFAPNDQMKRVEDRLLKRKNENRTQLILFPFKVFFYRFYLKLYIAKVRKVFFYSDVFILQSESIRNEYCSIYKVKDSPKLKVINNSLPFDMILPLEELKFKEQIVLVVGRMKEISKRFSIVLKVWKDLEEKYNVNDWELIFIGEGEDLGSYKQFAMQNKMINIKFLGRIDPFEYYRKASIFLMTSLAEGFSNTLLEAKQFGCVPIAFNSFLSVRDIITHDETGIIIEDNDVDNYTMQLHELIINKDKRTKMAARGLSDTHRFKIDSIGAQWLKLIQGDLL